jgi:hypothetical protein
MMHDEDMMKQNGSPFIVSRHPQKTDIPNKNIVFLPGLLRGFAPTASPARSLWAKTYGYGSIPINTIFSGMNIHIPAILMFTRGTRF